MSKKKVDLIKQELELYKSNPSLVMKQKGWTKAEYEKTIADLEQKLTQSKRGRSSKNRGANYERVIAKKFEDILGIELKRTPQSGGFAKDSKKAEEFRGDIVSLDDTIDFKLHVECKDQVTWALPQWIRQSEEDCPTGKYPVVIFHRRQLNKDGKRVQETGDFVSLSLEHFLELVDRDKVIVTKLTKPSMKLPKRGKKIES